MRDLRILTMLSVAAVLAACEKSSTGPGREDSERLLPGDTAQTRGTLLATGDSPFTGTLVWVPGTELVAFASISATCAVKTLDVASGTMRVVDSDCSHLSGGLAPYFRGLVAAPDGRALYYTLGIGAPGSEEWQLRVARPSGGSAVTLRSGVRSSLAVSPDGRYLAYVAHGDSLVVRDLETGVESGCAAEVRLSPFGGPVIFSPDGGALLYGWWEPMAWPLRRLSLTEGTVDTISLPAGVFHAQLFRWGASGIDALLEVGSLYRVHNITSGTSVVVGAVRTGAGMPMEGWRPDFEAWSDDGTRVAYWTERCHLWSGFLDCGVFRNALYVANTSTGARVRVAYTSKRPGPTVFSPDHRRLVYASGEERELYVVDVP